MARDGNVYGSTAYRYSRFAKIYKESYREILTADACAVDLHKFSLHFYELGSYVKHFDRKGDVHNILLHVSYASLTMCMSKDLMYQKSQFSSMFAVLMNAHGHTFTC